MGYSFEVSTDGQRKLLCCDICDEPIAKKRQCCGPLIPRDSKCWPPALCLTCYTDERKAKLLSSCPNQR